MEATLISRSNLCEFSKRINQIVNQENSNYIS